MRVASVSERAMQFQLSQENYAVPIATEAGVLIRLVELDGWIRVMVEVGEDATSRDLRGAIPLALQWRDRLLRWQGPWMGGGDTPFLEQLSERQVRGESYRGLADRINERVGELVREFARYIDEYNAAKPRFRTMMDFYLWQPTSNQFALDHARSMLRALRVGDRDVELLLSQALHNVRAGLPPFEPGYPVSRDKLIATLRTWRTRPQHTIRVSEDRPTSARSR